MLLRAIFESNLDLRFLFFPPVTVTKDESSDSETETVASRSISSCTSRVRYQVDGIFLYHGRFHYFPLLNNYDLSLSVIFSMIFAFFPLIVGDVKTNGLSVPPFFFFGSSVLYNLGRGGRMLSFSLP